MNNNVFCVFKLVNDSEPILWKILKSRDIAIAWIEKYSGEEQYIWEEWSVHDKSHLQ